MTDALKATSHKRKRKVEQVEPEIETKTEQKSTNKPPILSLKEAWDIIKWNFADENQQTIQVSVVDAFFASSGSS
jgi:uncharacterized protein (UPF0218 family)